MITKLDGHLAVPTDYATNLIDILDLLAEVLRYAGDELREDVAARYQHREADLCLSFAVGCGAESIQHFGAGVLDPREVERLLPEVQVERLPEPALQSGS